MACERARTMVAILSLIIPVAIGLLTFTWWLSKRMATQDGFLSSIAQRLTRIERHLKMHEWNGE